MNKWLTVAGIFILSLFITFLSQELNDKTSGSFAAIVAESSLIKQEVKSINNEPLEIVKMYNSGQLIGVVKDYSKVEDLLKEVYSSQYKEDFPNSKMGLGENIFISRELSKLNYEDVDDQICKYLLDNDQFSVETYSVELSDDKGTYATIYVRDVEDFYEARDRYLLNFISKEALDLISLKKQQPELKTYGRRELSVNIMENITISKALASPSKIMTNMEEVFTYLCYGDDPTPEVYVVEEYDMVEGVGSKNGGLTAEQVVTINPGILSSTEQVLEPGMELNVRYFDSPINIVVTQELIQKEIVYAPTIKYVENSELREGVQRSVQTEENGSKNVKYLETWINGVNVKGEEISSIVTKQPVQGIIEYGTKILPGVGSGSLRWPVDNPRITCRWYCYAGHTAIDVQNVYNRYGNVYAADRGTVIENSYHPISGYYMVIDHNNGWTTYYGHMIRPGFFSPGVKVEKGEVIGGIGMTGKTSGPHVHFALTINGTRRNPCDGYLPC